MTSAQTMPRFTVSSAPTRQPLNLILFVAAGLALCLSGGCQKTSSLGNPVVHVSPWVPEQLMVGVAPVLNESGVSIVDQFQVADSMQRALQDVHGFHAVSVNRVALAMRELGLQDISSPGDARSIMRALDLDALITGVVTSWDEYRPLQLGLAVDWYVRNDPRRVTLDPDELASRPNLPASAGSIGPAGPTARSSRLFDASNHQTLKWVREYADARTEPDSAYGRDEYLVRMDLYTEFACHRLVGDLLFQEEQRLQAEAQELR